MREWIQVNPHELNKPKVERRNGVDIQVFVSPYDIPDAVRGNYDQSRRVFVVDFRYLADDEDKVEHGGDEHIKYFVGRESRRLHRIEIDVDRLDVNAVGLEVNKVIANLPEADRRPSRRGNYEAAGRILENKKEELFATVGG